MNNINIRLQSISLVLICFLEDFVETPNNKTFILCRCRFTSPCLHYVGADLQTLVDNNILVG